jgi:hypothetical protein
MRPLIFLFFSVLLFAGCQKEVVIDNKTVLSAKVSSVYLNVSNASAVLQKSSYFSDKAQLTIGGEDNTNRITLLIKNYANNTGILSLDNAEALAVLTNKSSGVTDTASSGRLIFEYVNSNFYSIPELNPAGGFITGQVYKSENIAGTFEFITRNNVPVSAGIFVIAFNK